MGLMLPIQRRGNVETLREAMDYVYQLEEQVRHAVSALEGMSGSAAQANRAETADITATARNAAQNARAAAQSAVRMAREAAQAAEQAQSATGILGPRVEAVEGAVAELEDTADGLADDLDAETTARQTADTALGGQITAEATARQSEDTVLSGRITAEATARQNADTALAGDLAQEISDRETADEDITDYADEVAATSAHYNALMVTNVSELEGREQDVLEELQNMRAALASINVRVLNGPNLIKQNYTSGGTPNVIYGNVARWAGSSAPWLKSFSVINTENDGVTTTTDGDEITETLVTLAAADQIQETDGTIYTTAIAFTVANAPTSGYNNSDDLIYHYPTSGENGQLPMVDGETYTMSCWARVTSGDKMRIALKWGHPAPGIESWGNAKIIDTAGSAWHRVSWTFAYHDQVMVGSTERAMQKRVSFGVCRKYNGTVQLSGFRLTAGGLYEGTGLDILQNDIDRIDGSIASIADALTALEARVAALEGNGEGGETP